MTRWFAMSADDRRAMSDAMRHMHQAGMRRVDIRRASQLSSGSVHQAINLVILPGRDGISAPLSADVVPPRHVSSSSVMSGVDLLPVDLAGGGFAAPVIFAGERVPVDRDGLAEGSAGAVIGKSIHSQPYAASARGRHHVNEGGSTC